MLRSQPPAAAGGGPDRRAARLLRTGPTAAGRAQRLSKARPAASARQDCGDWTARAIRGNLAADGTVKQVWDEVEAGKPNLEHAPEFWQPRPQAAESEGLAGARRLKADLIEKGLRRL